MWDRLIGGAVEDTSKHSYGSGVNAFRRFCVENHISPRFSEDSTLDDVCILLSFIDDLFFRQHISADSVAGYITGLKSALVAQGHSCPALGPYKHRHYLVAKALRAISLDTTTVPPKPPRELFTDQMMMVAFVSWPILYYAMAVLVRGFILRSGELMLKKNRASKHLLYWRHVRFYDRQDHIIPRSRWTVELAYASQLFPSSRKHQPRSVREVPKRVRMFYPTNGSILSGLTSHYARGCAVAALQGLFMLTGAAAVNPDSTPLCYDNTTGQYLSQEKMLKYCHMMEPLFGLPKGTVVTHSLKHAGISLLIESGLSDEEVRLAAGFASVETLKIYHHAGKKMSLRLSRAAFLDASDSSNSDDEEVEEYY
jgi:hypothetical protein